MYSVSQRVSSIFSFFASCLGVVLPLLALLNYLLIAPPPKVDLIVERVNLYWPILLYPHNITLWLIDHEVWKIIMSVRIHGWLIWY